MYQDVIYAMFNVAAAAWNYPQQQLAAVHGPLPVVCNQNCVRTMFWGFPAGPVVLCSQVLHQVLGVAALCSLLLLSDACAAVGVCWVLQYALQLVSIQHRSV